MDRTRAWLPPLCAALIAACSCAPSPPPDDPQVPEACANGALDEGETDVDCGGWCTPCADGKACIDPPDCASGVCDGGACAAPTCTDGVKNGEEIDADCGGPCPKCGSGSACTTGESCASGVCLDLRCDCGDEVAVYVSAATGDDASAGIAGSPLATIQAAVACAQKVPREIRVAEGLYESSSANPVFLVEGKSLLGGWSAGFTARDPSAHVSVIRDTTDTGSSGTGVAVYLSSTSTATALDGFTIEATTVGMGTSASAVLVPAPVGQRAAATVRNNVLQCGGNPDILLARCIDLGWSGGSIVVEDNEIHLGVSDPRPGNGGKSWGIHGYDVQDVEIRRNLFDGGSSESVVPIDLCVAQAWSPLVEANDVRLDAGGAAGIRVQLCSNAASPAVRNNVVVVAGAATGIDDAAAAEISNNTVIAGVGAGIRTGVSGAQIRNNAIATEASGTCIAEESVTVDPYAADPLSVQNNDLYGCGTLYLDEASNTILSLVDLHALAGASGNISLDPMLDPGYRPLPGSPLLGAGQDLSSLFQTDKAGATRGGSWTIGAYQ